MDNADIDLAPLDIFATMPDRELLLSIARDMAATRALAAEAAAKVQPVIDGLSKHPMFKLFVK